MTVAQIIILPNSVTRAKRGDNEDLLQKLKQPWNAKSSAYLCTNSRSSSENVRITHGRRDDVPYGGDETPVCCCCHEAAIICSTTAGSERDHVVGCLHYDGKISMLTGTTSTPLTRLRCCPMASLCPRSSEKTGSRVRQNISGEGHR